MTGTSLATPASTLAAVTRCYVGPQGTYAPYCTQVISTALNEAVIALLDKLTTWQQRTRERDPRNAKAKRRYVAGLRCEWCWRVHAYVMQQYGVVAFAHQRRDREAKKCVQLHKARCLVVAPNVEAGGQGVEGPAESLESLLALAAERTTPLVFALTRKKLAHSCGARGGVSVVAVLDVSGAEQEYKEALALAEAGRDEWLKHNSTTPS